MADQDQVLNNQKASLPQSPLNMEFTNNMKREEEFINAKSFLLTASTKTGLNLYDHITKVLTKVLDQRPDNSVDIFEDLSKSEKQTNVTSPQSTLKDSNEQTTEVALAKVQNKLFAKDGEEDGAEEEQDVETPLPNLMELAFYFEQAGVGLSREEMVRIWLALKNLVDNHPLQHVRFWGKIFGTDQNYVVAEVEYREGEEEEEEEEEAEEGQEEETEKDNEDDEDEEQEEDDTPKPDYKPQPPIPKKKKVPTATLR